jgi:hypothetical protein
LARVWHQRAGKNGQKNASKQGENARLSHVNQLSINGALLVKGAANIANRYFSLAKNLRSMKLL